MPLQTFAVSSSGLEAEALNLSSNQPLIQQNPTLAPDVNGDGRVSPNDALMVINYLTRSGTAGLGEGVSRPPYFPDVDGNGTVQPLDALRVINFLNRHSETFSFEGEMAAEPAAESESSSSLTDRISDRRMRDEEQLRESLLLQHQAVVDSVFRNFEAE